MAIKIVLFYKTEITITVLDFLHLDLVICYDICRIILIIQNKDTRIIL